MAPTLRSRQQFITQLNVYVEFMMSCLGLKDDSNPAPATNVANSQLNHIGAVVTEKFTINQEKTETNDSVSTLTVSDYLSTPV